MLRNRWTDLANTMGENVIVLTRFYLFVYLFVYFCSCALISTSKHLRDINAHNIFFFLSVHTFGGIHRTWEKIHIAQSSRADEKDCSPSVWEVCTAWIISLPLCTRQLFWGAFSQLYPRTAARILQRWPRVVWFKSRQHATCVTFGSVRQGWQTIRALNTPNMV